MESRAQFLKGCARTLVLKVLSEKPMYGYEIATTLARRSENIFSLGQGTLYPLLYSLEKKGMIRVSAKVKDKRTRRERLYYKLTAKGEKSLEANLVTWSEIARGMSLVLGAAYV